MTSRTRGSSDREPATRSLFPSSSSVNRAGLDLISVHLRETGNALDDLFILLHTPSAQKLSAGSGETIRSILDNLKLYTNFSASLRTEKHPTWRRLTRATIRRDWPLWLKEYWTPIATATELVTTMRAADEHCNRRLVGLRATDAPLLYGASRLFQKARDIGVEHDGHIVLSAREVKEAAEVAAWAARRESLVPRSELKRLRPAARPPATNDDFWGDHEGMWWLGGSS
jgi:hypothetical protein